MSNLSPMHGNSVIRLWDNHCHSTVQGFASRFPNPILRDLIIPCLQVMENRRTHWFGLKKKGIILSNINFHYTIRSEQEDQRRWVLRYILEMAGWVKKRNQNFSLTQKGQIMVQNGFGQDDFFHLFETYTVKFNWASGDLYPMLNIIQESLLFSCYLLHKKANSDVHTKELSGYFIQAFQRY